MYGLRGGWRRFRGNEQKRLPPATPAGCIYVGPCRCGFGPHAYYQDTSGKVVPARTVFGGPMEAQPSGSLATELEKLKMGKAALERRLADLEERLKGQD